jgi:hypothetical protein
MRFGEVPDHAAPEAVPLLDGLAGMDENLEAALGAIRPDEEADHVIEFYGRQPLGTYLNTFLYHEALHQGQWRFYATLGGFETPQSWQLTGVCEGLAPPETVIRSVQCAELAMMRTGLTRCLMMACLVVGVLFVLDTVPTYASGNALLTDGWSTACGGDVSPPDTPDQAVVGGVELPGIAALDVHGGHSPPALPALHAHYAQPARAPPVS